MVKALNTPLGNIIKDEFTQLSKPKMERNISCLHHITNIR